MHGELLMLFVILLLGLILCSFLGGAGCREGMENASYTGPNGSTAQVKSEANGKNSLVITNSDGTTSTYTPSVLASNTYTGPNEGTAQITTGSNGNKVVQVTQKDGTVHTYTLSDASTIATTSTDTASSTTSSNNYDNYDHYSGSSIPSIFYGPNGGTAKVVKTPNNNSIVITNKNGTTEIYYIDNNTASATITAYYGPNGGSAKMIKDSAGKTAVEITTPNGSKVVYTGDNAYTYNSQDDTINQYSADSNTTGSDYNSAFSANSYTGPKGTNVKATTISGPAGNTYATYDSSAYSNSLPPGIPKNQIPPGDEDLYILKSQVVPPVCPRCPDPIIKSNNNGSSSNGSSSNGSSSNGSSSNDNGGSTDNTKCPPCPACARCPEPAFDCVKRPNYNAFNPSYMPMPVVSDFSTFGM